MWYAPAGCQFVWNQILEYFLVEFYDVLTGYQTWVTRRANVLDSLVGQRVDVLGGDSQVGEMLRDAYFDGQSTFTASSFRILNSSTGIPSPPLALFIMMLSKAHLTSHYRMSGSRSVITPS